MLLGLYLFVVVALPLALGWFVAFNGLPRTRQCPGCAGATLRLRARPLAVANRFLRQTELHRRWCPQCDWHGTARLEREPAFLAALATPRTEPRAEAPADTIELRRIRLNNADWRVRVQCWAEAGEWHARLLFLPPDGGSWIRDEATLTGPTAIDVFTRVLSLPDRALSGRIRKATH